MKHVNATLITLFAMGAFIFCMKGAAFAAPGNTSQAVLYYLPECPHCQKVEQYLDSVHKKLTMKNIKIPQYHEEFEALRQEGVPVLVVNGEVIVGSTAIINYLTKHKEVLK